MSCFCFRRRAFARIFSREDLPREGAIHHHGIGIVDDGLYQKFHKLPVFVDIHASGQPI